MEKRTAAIKESFDKAGCEEQNAEKLKKEYEQKIAQAQQEAEEIIAKAKITAEAEFHHIIKEARQEQEQIMKETRVAMEQERIKSLQQIQDEIAISQLRHILNAASSIETDGYSLQFVRKYESAELYLTNRHLILAPGTQIYLEDIDGAEFYKEMHIWMIRYEREGELFEKPLIHE